MHVLALAIPAEPIEAAQEKVDYFLKFLYDHPFEIALTLVFLTAIIGAFVAARKRDRCLKKFREFPVTVRDQSGRPHWGWLRVFSKGLELRYGPPAAGASKRTFLLYEAELGSILTISRFTDRLSVAEAARRSRQVALLVHLRVAGRIWRGLRNIINTFRDAIVQAMGLTAQQAAKVAPNPLLAPGPGSITAFGTTLVGAAANAYEPMLEQYIGHAVVLELANPADPDKRVVEYRGVLGEYSDKYILLVGLRERFTERAPLDGQETHLLEDALVVRGTDGRLVVENRSGVAVTVEAVVAGGARAEVGTSAAAGASADVPLPDEARAEGAVAVLAFERTFDLIVPRAIGTVRHAGAEA